MARPKYTQWLEPAGLEKITNWAANGCTLNEIARNMGIHPSTLARWMDAQREICEAVKSGQALAVEAVENALFRKATGQYVVEETVEEFKGSVQDGKPTDGELTRRTVKKQGAPDTGAMIFYLKNRVPEKYSDRRVVETATTAPSVVLGVTPRRADG